MRPILSIVIANYNYGRYLRAAIDSVLSQCGSPVKCEDGHVVLPISKTSEFLEIIVCDAASTDGSVDILRELEGYFAWWCSERDGGQSAAFNKGFARSSGRFLTWLNADDLYAPGALMRFVNSVANHPDAEWFAGNTYRFRQDGTVFQLWWGPWYYPMWLQRRNAPVGIYGPTTFFSRESYDKVGRIDEKMHFLMDTDLWVRMMAAGYKMWRIPGFCWGFRMHEESKTAQFDGHVLDASRRRAFDAEREYFKKKNNYSMNLVLHLMLSVWRLLDGSYLFGRWLERRYKTVEDLLAR